MGLEDADAEVIEEYLEAGEDDTAARRFLNDKRRRKPPNLAEPRSIPVVNRQIRKTFKMFQAFAPKEESEEEEEEEVQEFDAAGAVADLELRAYRYRLQYDIHQTIAEKIKTADLLKKDDMIVRDFNILTSDFHSKVRGRTLALNSMVALTQDALICRIANFPTPIARNSIQKNSIPKILIRSKQIFEGIFTYLQSHPCYLITWLKKVITEPA